MYRFLLSEIYIQHYIDYDDTTYSVHRFLPSEIYIQHCIDYDDATYFVQISAATFSGDSFLVTSNFVVPESNVQGSYLDLPVGRDLAVLTVELVSLGTCTTGYAALSEIEIFVDGTQPAER